jgi:hypothetical protein
VVPLEADLKTAGPLNGRFNSQELVIRVPTESLSVQMTVDSESFAKERPWGALVTEREPAKSQSPRYDVTKQTRVRRVTPAPMSRRLMTKAMLAPSALKPTIHEGTAASAHLAHACEICSEIAKTAKYSMGAKELIAPDRHLASAPFDGDVI